MGLCLSHQEGRKYLEIPLKFMDTQFPKATEPTRESRSINNVSRIRVPCDALYCADVHECSTRARTFAQLQPATLLAVHRRPFIQWGRLHAARLAAPVTFTFTAHFSTIYNFRKFMNSCKLQLHGSFKLEGFSFSSSLLDVFSFLMPSSRA